MVQFLDTLNQIMHCDSVTPLNGIRRHLGWQLRRVFNGFPVDLRIGASSLRANRACGVAALVNAMGEYDFNNMEFLRFLLAHSNGTFVDIGANIGSYTLVASEIARATVISIEPHPLTFSWLRENISLNGRINVKCLNIALSDRDGQVWLTNGRDVSVNRVLAEPNSNIPNLRIESRRLETLCSSLNIIPEFLKIDVEGHELSVLEGLGTYRLLPKLITVENGENWPIRQWMETAGFAGPFFAHFSERSLLPHKQHRPEDPIYVSSSFVPEIRNLGFVLASG